MLKMIFMKSLPLVRLKMFLKLRMLRIYRNLEHIIFQISRSWFWRQKLIFIKHLAPIRPKLVPRLKILWNLCLMFQIFQSWLRDMIKVTLNNYMLCKIGLPAEIPISIITCKVIFMKYTQLTSIIVLKSLLSLKHFMNWCIRLFFHELIHEQI